MGTMQALEGLATEVLIEIADLPGGAERGRAQAEVYHLITGFNFYVEEREGDVIIRRNEDNSVAARIGEDKIGYFYLLTMDGYKSRDMHFLGNLIVNTL